MTQTDILNDILSSNPNDPCPTGAVLFLRNEMRSEFKTVRTKLEQHDERFNLVDERFNKIDEQLKEVSESLDMLARQINILVSRK